MTCHAACSPIVLAVPMLRKCTRARALHQSYPIHSPAHGRCLSPLRGYVRSVVCNRQRTVVPSLCHVGRCRQPVQSGNGERLFAYTLCSPVRFLHESIRPGKGWLCFPVIMAGHCRWVGGGPVHSWRDDVRNHENILPTN